MVSELSTDQNVAVPQTKLRSPDEVMRLRRMGSFFPTRLSFLRSLLRKLAAESAPIRQVKAQLDADGFGHVVYQVGLDGYTYSLIAYSNALDDNERTDRVIAQAWDACFVLFDGKPTDQDIAELHAHATRQETGRYDPRVLVLSRANKSVRLFEHVADSLAVGRQPDEKTLASIGYLMRTTAVYGNGKFGMADRADFMQRNSLSQPFRLEMLTVYLIREFTLDLIDHVAKARGGASATPLASHFRRQLGIGNSTGLGMAPFLVSHPVLINNWMLVRETALARVRDVVSACEDTKTQFLHLVDQVQEHLLQWNVDDKLEQERIVQLRSDWARFSTRIVDILNRSNPWDHLISKAQNESVELQELLVALVLEPHGDLIDGLCDCMEDTVGPKLDATMTIGEFQTLLKEHYDWALALDLNKPDARSLVWYVSEDKAEPRMGARDQTSEERREMPHHIAHKVQALAASLEQLENDQPLAVLLVAEPQHRDIARRVQTVARHPYGEIRDNLVAQGVRPIDLLRCKLSYFGASKFDPRSDRWTRITLYQGAPTASELTMQNCGDVFLPAFDPFAE